MPRSLALGTAEFLTALRFVFLFFSRFFLASPLKFSSSSVIIFSALSESRNAGRLLCFRWLFFFFFSRNLTSPIGKKICWGCGFFFLCVCVCVVGLLFCFFPTAEMYYFRPNIIFPTCADISKSYFVHVCLPLCVCVCVRARVRTCIVSHAVSCVLVLSCN